MRGLARWFIPAPCTACGARLWWVPGHQYRQCRACGLMNWWPLGARRLDECGATDGEGLEGGRRGRCSLPAGHDGDWHRQIVKGRVWAEWRGPHPGTRCGICGKDGGQH